MAENTAVATKPSGAMIKQTVSIKSMLANPDTSWGRELTKVLPSAKMVAKFMSCALAQLADPKVGTKLAACTTASFYNAIMKAGRVGILPDGVNAYLIPYGKECTLQFSYRGLCDMAIREGIATKFVADIVCRNDTFIWRNAELIEHTPAGWDEEERGDIVGVWVRVFLPDGSTKDERMSVSEVEKIRAKSQNPGGTWREWYGEMMKKSCLKRLFKTMQNTPTMADIIAEDNKEFNLDKPSFDRSNRVAASDILGGVTAEDEPKPDAPPAKDDTVDVTEV